MFFKLFELDLFRQPMMKSVYQIKRTGSWNCYIDGTYERMYVGRFITKNLLSGKGEHIDDPQAGAFDSLLALALRQR
jgi:hypothetical protein